MAAIDEIFRLIKEQGASDLHMASGSRPMLRVDSDLVPVEYDRLTPELNRRLLFELMDKEQIARFEKDREIDFGYEVPGVTRLRCNIFEQRNGISGVFRLIPTEILTTEQLDLPRAITDFCDMDRGLVVVTGATGSGKSTTLAAMVDYINKNYKRHIITIEDPIEFVHRNQQSLVNQRELGVHTRSFAAALRSALREDPDIVLVGEMRDLETIQLAITAAETGHLVFGTLHTNSAPSTVDRIIDVFPSDQQAQVRVMLAESLKGVVAQRLLPRSGEEGRVAAHEILVATPAVAAAIRNGQSHQIPSMMQTGRKDGMQTLDMSLASLVDRGLVDMSVAVRHASSPAAFTRGRMALGRG